MSDQNSDQPNPYPGSGLGGGSSSYGPPPAQGHDQSSGGQPQPQPGGSAPQGYDQAPGYTQPQQNQPQSYGQPQGYGSGMQHGQQGAAPTAYHPGQGPDGYAPWGKRVSGYLLDGLAPGLAAYALFIICFLINHTLGVIVGIVAYLALLAFVVWNRWLQGGRTGQTIGRRQQGITMISEETGQPIGPLMAFVRDIAHMADSFICYIGWLFPLWDSKRQTLADKIVKTVVVPVENTRR